MEYLPTKLRALLDQVSQTNLSWFRKLAAQRLHMRKQDAIVSGVGISNNKSHGTVLLTCESVYQNYNFTIAAKQFTQLHVWAPTVVTFLLDNINISRPVDILLGAGVYAQIVMDGILQGPIHAPIAQQNTYVSIIWKTCLIPLEPNCYLPHHGVMKLDSTATKLRVVFNASNKTTSGHSLNELMECGPNLQQD